MIIEVNPGDAGGVAELSARKQDSIQNAIGLFRLDGWTQAAEGEPYTQTIQIGQEVFPDGTSRDFLATYKYPSVIASPSEDSMGEIALAEAKITAFDSIENALSYSVTASATEPPSTDVTFEFIIYGDNDTLGDLITDTTKAYIDNEVPALIDSMVSDAPITLVTAQNNEIGQFTLNQTGGQDLVIPSASQAFEDIDVVFATQSPADFPDYPLCATYAVQGLTSANYASVTYSDAQVGTSLFAPFCQTKDDGYVYLYAKAGLTTLSQHIPTICVGLEDISAAQTESALLNGKVDKLTTTGLKVYIHNGATQGEAVMSASGVADSVAQRNASGRVVSADPASGATDTTVATTNWVSQTGNSSPNNLVHRTGAESIGGWKGFNDGAFNKYLIFNIPASGDHYIKISIIANTTQVVKFRIYSFVNNLSSAVFDCVMFWNGGSSRRLYVRRLGGTNISIDNFKLTYDGTNLIAFIKCVSYHTVFVNIENAFSWTNQLTTQLSHETNPDLSGYTLENAVEMS